MHLGDRHPKHAQVNQVGSLAGRNELPDDEAFGLQRVWVASTLEEIGRAGRELGQAMSA